MLCYLKPRWYIMNDASYVLAVVPYLAIHIPYNVRCLMLYVCCSLRVSPRVSLRRSRLIRLQASPRVNPCCIHRDNRVVDLQISRVVDHRFIRQGIRRVSLVYIHLHSRWFNRPGSQVLVLQSIQVGSRHLDPVVVRALSPVRNRR